MRTLLTLAVLAIPGVANAEPRVLDGVVIIGRLDATVLEERRLADDERATVMSQIQAEWPARAESMRRSMEASQRIATERDTHYQTLRTEHPDEYDRLRVAEAELADARRRAERVGELQRELLVHRHNAWLCLLNARRAELREQSVRVEQFMAHAAREIEQVERLYREIMDVAGRGS